MNQAMNDHETTRLLERLAQTFPDQPAPLPDLLAAAHGAGRRRTRSRWIAAATSATLVAAGLTIGYAVSQGDPVPEDPEIAQGRVVPEGMRLVGLNGVAMAVPETWSVQRTRCGTQPAESTVIFTEVESLYCSIAPLPPYPALQVLSDSTRQGAALSASVTGSASRGGVRTVEGFVDCGGGPESCGVYVVDVPEAGVVFVLRGEAAEPGMRDGYLESIRPIEEGFVAVPYVAAGTLQSEAAARLEAVGLTASAVGDGVDQPVRATDPPAGAVVAEGTEVALDLDRRIEMTMARRVVEDFLEGEPSARVRIATASWRDAPDPDLAQDCGSADLVSLRLYGVFPNTSVAGLPSESRLPSVALLAADASTGAVCSSGVGVGPTEPGPDELVVYRDDRPEYGYAFARWAPEIGENILAVSVPGEQPRGVGYALEKFGGDCCQVWAWLTAATAPEDAVFAVNRGRGSAGSRSRKPAWGDEVVTGPGPDYLRLSDNAATAGIGAVRICTVDAPALMCFFIPQR